VRREQSLANLALHRIAARLRFGIKPKVDGGAARGERWALVRQTVRLRESAEFRTEVKEALAMCAAHTTSAGSRVLDGSPVVVCGKCTNRCRSPTRVDRTPS
jgi:hypothetical protein